ncbi:unnamed protein product [Coffea canephora]|uniref:HAT C-terminal dimerisation domain-containing protein n=1 Tax=Coffea canephora TaxID=49390 RepID=A0A068VCA5_COFCA|nr:unnamed protein product [Coffea canephora]
MLQIHKSLQCQTVSSSGCKRNWSIFECIHTKKRNRLKYQKLNDLEGELDYDELEEEFEKIPIHDQCSNSQQLEDNEDEGEDVDLKHFNVETFLMMMKMMIGIKDSNVVYIILLDNDEDLSRWLFLKTLLFKNDEKDDKSLKN